MSLTIVHVLPSPDNVGGTERTAHLAAEGLRVAGHRVYLLHDRVGSQPAVVRHYDGDFGNADFHDTRSPLPLPRYRNARIKVGQWLDAIGVDIVHVHGYPRTANLRWLAGHYPTVATVHVPLCPNGARYLWGPRCVCERRVGLTCVTQGYRKDGCGRLGNGVPMSPRMFARACFDNVRLRGALHACTRLIVPSHWMAERLRTDGFAAGRLSVLSPPIPPPQSSTGGDVAIPPAVLFVGRLVEVKGVADLLEASAAIESSHQIWIAGEGPDRQRLEALTARLGIADRVHFFGNLSPDQVDAVRVRATLAVLPSRWPETFAMTGPEAMATGLPVVAYRVGAVAEWLSDGVTGLLVPSGDIAAFARGIRSLLNDKALLSRFAAAGRASTDQWSPGRHVRDLQAIYLNARNAATPPADVTLSSTAGQ